MARHDYNILNQLFPATRQDLNNLFIAIQSTNSGAGTPAATVAYMRYIDTSSSEILMRNAADTGSISLRKTTGEVIAPLGSVSGASYSFGTDFNTGMFSPGANNIGFTTSGVERLRIGNTGNVGIGTTSPAFLLSVSSNVDSDGDTVRIVNSNTGTSAAAVFSIKGQGNEFSIKNYGDGTSKANETEFYSGAGGSYFVFSPSNSEAMRIDSSGRLGVGTTNPLAKLDVTSATTGYTARFGKFDSNGLFLYSESQSTHYNWRITTQTAVGGGFEIAPSTAEGGTTWDTPYFVLRQGHRHSIGNTNTYNNCLLTLTQPTAGQLDRLLAIQTPVTAYSYAIQFVNPNGRVGTISTSGTSTSYNTSSDYRLKENIKPIDNILERFKKLKPCSFNFLSDKKMIVDGFLAHEVQEVIPEAVTGVKDEMDEDGTPKYQGIDQSKLVPLLVASVQEILKRLEALEK
jgi:hypothetical protein